MSLDPKVHEIAIDRLKTRLFQNQSPAEYGFKPETREVIPQVTYNNETSMGGLSFEIAHPRYEKLVLKIEHFKGSKFNVFISDETNGHTLRATTFEFDNLDHGVKSLVESITDRPSPRP